MEDRAKGWQEEAGNEIVTQVMVSKPASPPASPGDILHSLGPCEDWGLLVFISLRDRNPVAQVLSVSVLVGSYPLMELRLAGNLPPRKPIARNS